MGFPRILSKNNKIYTKLGEFCLSGDGNQFWIVCHTCQEELQTQDHFWKHIQDEHNFLHGMKQEQSRSTTVSFIESDMPALPLPLYRKVEDAQRMGADQDDDDDSQEQQEPKDYTEMRAIEPSVEIDIKVEPISQPLPPPPPAQAHLGVNATPTTTLYQLPQVPPGGASGAGAYAGIAHTPPVSLMPALSVLAAAAPPPPAAMMVASHLPHELPKDSNSTTASASSAVSSDDGERWYICDYETCGLKFKYQSRLELHRSVHSKERRFACELCGASFKQSCNLSTHRKKKHFLKGTKGLVQQRY